MKVPSKWLRDFIDVDAPPEELARMLTLAGLEVEKIEYVGAGWDKVFTAEVRSVIRHPDADRLVLADVEAGEHRLTVVTGAPNIEEGQKVALALAGARLIDGHSDSGEYRVLKPGKIRGIMSDGMVCSEKELGISDEHEGILVLPDDAPVGVPLADYLGDIVFEFEITPNLAHDFSVRGIARELGAIYRRPTSTPPTMDPDSLPPAAAGLVTIEDADLCARYVGVVIDGIVVEPSPEWMARRLNQAGIRSINNIVDVTNYVMLEYGQPLHAFDFEQVAGRTIVVRRARAGERIETLDHVERVLEPTMLVIADANDPIAIAGVMGGAASEVSDATTSIVLEAAAFDMTSVRHTARALKLRTDASARFERGVDPELASMATARAVWLIKAIYPTARIAGVADVYPVPVVPRSLTMPLGRIEQILGVQIEDEEISRVLTDLEFAPSIDRSGPAPTLTVTIPTYRADVSIPEDIVEEVGRIVGYDRVPATLPVGQTVPVVRDPGFLLQTDMRSSLTGAGLNEAVTYVTASESMLSPFSTDDGIVGVLYPRRLRDLLRLVNPLHGDRPYLRNTLLPALLEVTSSNLRHERRVALFEMARAYLPIGRNELPDERQTLAIVLAGARDEISRFATNGDLDYFDLKGAIDVLLERVGITSARFEASEVAGFHPGRTARVFVDEDLVGIVGELHPATIEAFDIETSRVAAAELDLDLLLAKVPKVVPPVSVPKFLPVQQDLAIVVSEETPAERVEASLRSGAGPLLTGIVLFDVFRGEQIGDGNKSLAYRLTFTSPGRALTDQDLVKVRGKIERTLKQDVAGRLRA